MALVGAAVVEVLNQLPSNGLAREVAVRAARRRRSLMVGEWRRTVEGGGVGEEVTSGHPHDLTTPGRRDDPLLVLGRR